MRVPADGDSSPCRIPSRLGSIDPSLKQASGGTAQEPSVNTQIGPAENGEEIAGIECVPTPVQRSS